jgi:hypothetical protein
MIKILNYGYRKLMKRIIIVMSIFSFLFGGCSKKGEKQNTSSSKDTAQPAKGLICVYAGSPKRIEQAIKSYIENIPMDKPHDFRVSVIKHKSGFSLVGFPDGIPTYDLINLILWLNNPPDMPDISKAIGWITSPATNITYFLQPETENSWGDTLIGASSNGKSVKVYTPEVGMCEISSHMDFIPEPDLSAINVESSITLYVTLDAYPSFENHEFKITHPKDTTW